MQSSKEDCCDNDNDVCQDTSMEENSESEDDSELSDESESFSDKEDEWYHKEMDDIAAKKQAFLKSKKVKSCMKCNKGGCFLTCTSNACSFAIHESCLGNDSRGMFYCPFCLYSQSISDYWASKKKASLARKYLGSFNGLTLKNGLKKCRKQDQFVYGNCIESQIPNEVLPLAVLDLRNEMGEGSSEKADYRDYSTRLQEQVNRRPYLHVPRRRRIPVPWTQLEEETLKKAMQNFVNSSTIHNRGVPWREILDHGASVFQKSRTPGDLKDKWRNMVKVNKE